jgi:hypothetical protein
MDEDADATAIAFDEEGAVARIGERASVDVREHDDAVHPQLVERPLELAQRRVRVVHRDRGEPLEALRVPRREIRVGVVDQTRDLGLPLRWREIDVGCREREDLDVDADSVHVLEAARRVGHRGRDAEESRSAVADDRAAGGIGAE